jgi:hypothetical protein
LPSISSISAHVADHFVGPRACQDREAQCPRVIIADIGKPLIEVRHIAPRHRLMMLNIVRAGAQPQLAGQGVPQDGFDIEANITVFLRAGFPRRERLVSGVLINRFDRQRGEVRDLAEQEIVAA